MMPLVYFIFLAPPFLLTCLPPTHSHRWELPVDYPVFTVVMGIYHYVERIGEFLLPQIFGITYIIMKNIIQVN